MIVEAFTIIHAFIEFEMANLYELNYTSKGWLHELIDKKIMENYRFD